MAARGAVLRGVAWPCPGRGGSRAGPVVPHPSPSLSLSFGGAGVRGHCDGMAGARALGLFA